MDQTEYSQPRKKPTAAEIRLHLIEVDNLCPLCGTILQSYGQKKPDARLFEIAHIYPNSPTQEQLHELKDVPQLGINSESFENKIALCKNCHDTQDYHTKKDEYMKLYNIKKNLINQMSAKEDINAIPIEKQILTIIEKIKTYQQKDFAELKLYAIPVSKKFNHSEILLKKKVENYVNTYYKFIKFCFSQIEGETGFSFNELATEIKLAFLKAEKQLCEKELIFEQLVNWLNTKTENYSRLACEAVISFFVQNCEVFNEISE